MLRTTAVAVGLLAVGATSASAAPERAAAPATHGNPAAYVDIPVLDAVSGAPEIFVTTVANSSTNVITFDVVLANRSGGLTGNDVVAIFIDADRNGATGVPNDGSDYVLLGYAGNVVRFVRWTGSAFEPTANPASFAGRSEGTSQVFEIAAADLGGTTALHFYVFTQLLDNADAYDASPSPANEVWVYTLGAPHVERVTPRFSPGQPRAGRAFRVTGVQLTLASEETVAGTAFRCSATLAGRRIRGTGPGGCRFALPRTARGKRLVVTVTVDDQGQAKTSRTTFRVRA